MALVFEDRWRDTPSRLGRAALLVHAVSELATDAMRAHVRHLGCDVRDAWRAIRRAPFFAAAVVATLALGLGVNAAVFSVLERVVLRALPVPHAGALHSVRERSADPPPGADRYSYPQFERFSAVLPPGTGLAAASRIARMPARVAGGSGTDILRVQLVSDGFFEVLQVTPAAGRVWLPADGQPADRHAVVISHRLWQRLLGGSLDALGKTITVGAVPLTVVGVAPAGFHGLWLELPVDLWAPLSLQHLLGYAQSYHVRDADDREPWLAQDGIGWLDVLARATPDRLPALGVALNGAFRQDNETAAASLTDPDERRRRLNRELALEPVPQGFSTVRERFAAWLWALQGMALIVLIVGCLNAAHLLLVRAAARRRELAIRVSLGAGRSRLVQQLLVESALLVAIAAGAGLVLAGWSVGVLTHMAEQTVPGVTELSVSLDARVLLVTAASAMAAVVTFGGLPAVLATRVQAFEALKSASKGPGGSGLPAGRALIVGQVAFSVLLVLSAGLLGRSLQERLAVDLGFEPQQVLSVELAYQRFAAPDIPAAYEHVERELEMVPGVQSVSAALCGVAAGCGWFSAFAFEGHQPRAGEPAMAQLNVVTPGYFETVGMRLRAGRTFDERDREQAPLVAIVNESLARRYFPGRSALGARLGYSELDTIIVGVVDDARVTNIKEEPVPFVFFPLRQRVFPPTSVELRTALPPAILADPVRTVLARTAPDLRIERVVPLVSQVRSNLGQERLSLALMSGYGMLALALSAVGLFSTLSYAVARRRHELGIRMALGAAPRRLLIGVMGEALALAAAGAALGVPTAIGAAFLAEGLLYGVRPFDPASVLGTLAVLAAVAAVAAWLPAWRASRVNPLTALRSE